MARISGPCENRAFYTHNIAISPLLRDMPLNHLGVNPFLNNWNNDEIVTMAYLTNFGRSLVANPQAAPDRTLMYVAVMAELIGPHLPEEMFAPHDDAINIFENAVRALARHPNLATITQNNLANYLQASAAAPEVYKPEIFGPADADDITLNILQEPERYVRILRHFTLGVTQAYRMGGLALIANITISVSKRGIVSQQFIEKIENGIHTDLGKQIVLNSDAIRLYYQSFGRNIDANNIQLIHNRWLALIPGQALRLQLTVQQLAGSGLTAFITIGRAMRLYNDFDWNTIAALYPQDYVHFEAAVNVVDGNLYYGFNSDLGPVKSTNYKNLSYVAKELLVKVGGEVALNRYAGWPRRVADQGRVDIMIAEYEQGHGVVNARNLELGANTHNRVFAAVNDNVNDNIFM